MQLNRWFLIILIAGASLGVGVFYAPAIFAGVEQFGCVLSSKGRRGSELALGGGGDTYFLQWMDQIESGKVNVVHVADTLSPRSLQHHDRLVLPGTPDNWIAAADGLGLVMCHRKVKAFVIIRSHFCSGPLSARDVRNGEIEEITFLGGTTWLADDILAGAPAGKIPAEIRENIESDFNMQYGGENPPSPGPAPNVNALLSRWRIVPMSKALGTGKSQARCAKN